MSPRAAVRGLPVVCNIICHTAPSVLVETLSRLQASSGGACGLLVACQPLLRAFATSPSEAHSAVPSDGFEIRIRKVAPLIQLQQDLQNASELHDSIPYEKLEQMTLNRGAARTEHDAKAVIQALHRVGVILHDRNRVFLNPGSLLKDILPDFPSVSELEQQLQELNDKLAPFDRVHQEAAIQTRRILGTGCGILFLQLVGFYHLTFNELSWDVMEPIAYLLSVFYTFVGYTYFLATRGNVFDLKPFEDACFKYFKVKKLRQSSQGLGEIEIDEERYQQLVKVRQRCIKRLEVARKLKKHRSSAQAS